MKWNSKGLIFDLKSKQLSFLSFAQSPQTLVLKDRLRVFFSTRKKEENGKYVSHIAYVDYDEDWNIIALCTEGIIRLGNLGEFDEHGIFPINPLKVGDEVWAYTTGWSRRVSVSVETAIGLAKSTNEGHTFTKIGAGGPLVANNLHEPLLVGDAFVKNFHNQFYMWYIYGTHWLVATDTEPEARIYKIAQATSSDGVVWQRDSRCIIADSIPNECQALPTVIAHKGTFHLFFCFRHPTDFRKNPLRGYQIGYAFSNDLLHWTRDDTKLAQQMLIQEWCMDMRCYPHIFEWQGKIWLLYNGNEFGKYGFGLAELESF